LYDASAAAAARSRLSAAGTAILLGCLWGGSADHPPRRVSSGEVHGHREKAIEMLRRIEKRCLELLANQALTELTISTAERLRSAG
jgi:hypothetical protein